MKFISLLFCILVFAFPSGAQQTAPQSLPSQTAPSVENKTKVPVVVNGKVLFELDNPGFHTNLESRLDTLIDRLEQVAKRSPEKIDKVNIRKIDIGDAILLDDVAIVLVTDQDAKSAGRTRDELAKEWAVKLKSAAKELQESYSTRNIILSIVWVALATLSLVAFFWFFKFIFSRIYRRMQIVRERLMKAQGVIVDEQSRLMTPLISIVRLIRVVLTIVVLHLYMNLVLALLPWTKNYTFPLARYLKGPFREITKSFTAWLPNLFSILVLIVVFYFVLKLLRFIFLEIERKRLILPGFYPEWAEPTYKIARFIFIALAGVAIFPYIPGSKSPAFQGISLFIGLLLSLGSSGAVANIVAGLTLTYTRAFILGDVIKIGDALGSVAEKTLLVTRIKTPKNVLVSIPNATVVGSHVTNYTAELRQGGTLILNTSVAIGYDTPWRQVHQLLLLAADRTSGLLKQPPPFVLQRELQDSYVKYELNAHTNKTEGMLKVYSELHQSVLDAFNEYGVQIMSPNYEGDPQAPKIVPRDRWFESPARKEPPTGKDGL